MERHDAALVLTLLPHGEHGAVVRFLGLREGLVAAYVHGARSRARRADLAPGNRVRLVLRGRLRERLPTATLEVEASRALLAFDPAPAAALAYLVELLAGALPEGEPDPALAERFDALLDRMAGGGDWPAAMVRFERDLLSALGFGLDLGVCALSGRRDGLAFVSPRSGRAVSAAAAEGQPWARRLLPLPGFLCEAEAEGMPAPDAEACAAGFALTGHFLARHVFPERPRAEALRREALARMGLSA